MEYGSGDQNYSLNQGGSMLLADTARLRTHSLEENGLSASLIGTLRRSKGKLERTRQLSQTVMVSLGGCVQIALIDRKDRTLPFVRRTSRCELAPYELLFSQRIRLEVQAVGQK